MSGTPEIRVCATSGCASVSFSYQLDAAAEVCHECGAVQPNTTEFEVLGRVLEADALDGDEGHTGRNYIRVEDSNLESNDPFVESEVAEKYHKKREAEIEILMKKVLNSIRSIQLFAAVKQLFYKSKAIGKLKWGERANVIAHACVYVVARQHNKNVTTVDVATYNEIDVHALARAAKYVKDWNQIVIRELDPQYYVEKIIDHTVALLKIPNPPHTGPKKSVKHFTPQNLKFLRSLNIPDVRTLAASLLSLTKDIDLTAGRAPEQVACAVVVVAMEGIARIPSPGMTQLFDEYSTLLLVKTFTAAERYGEVMAMLAKYGPLIPWIAADFKGKGRRNVAKHTADIVNFTKIDKKKIEEEKQAALRRDYPMQPKLEEGVVVKKEEDGVEDLEEDDDPSRVIGHDPKVIKVIDEHALTVISSARAAASKRPEEFMRLRPGPNKRVSSIKQVAAAVFLPFDKSASTSALSGPIPCPMNGPNKSFFRQKSGQETFAPHSDETVKFRQQLLAGVEPFRVIAGVLNFDDEIYTPRLTKLLWTKKESDITEDELWAEGELDAQVRNDEEVELMRGEIDAIIERSYEDRKRNLKRKYSKRKVRNIEGEFIDIDEDKPKLGEDAPSGKKKRKSPSTKASRINHSALNAILASTGEFNGVAGVTDGLAEDQLFKQFASADLKPAAIEEESEEDSEEEGGGKDDANAFWRRKEVPEQDGWDEE